MFCSWGKVAPGDALSDEKKRKVTNSNSKDLRSINDLKIFQKITQILWWLEIKIINNNNISDEVYYLDN